MHFPLIEQVCTSEGVVSFRGSTWVAVGSAAMVGARTGVDTSAPAITYGA